MLIKAGYRLSVVSWENDSDNYNTKTIDGLTKERTAYLVDCARLFARDGRCGYGVGNLVNDFVSSSDTEKVKRLLFEVATKHKEELNMDYITEDMGLIGLMGCSEHYYSRVCDKITVEFVEKDIIIPDVTKEFVNENR